MRLFGRVSKRERAAMFARLYELEREYAGTAGARTIRDGFIFYAAVGRDRKKLGMEWAEKAKVDADEAVEFEKLIALAVER